jgi:tetratricopeptide (TPR) repeat protein
MKKWFVIIAMALALVLSGQSPAFSSEQPSCKKNDMACQEFTRLAAAEQYDKIIEKVSPTQNYSDEARKQIGQAYLMVAGRETNTPEQEEQLCQKALEYGATSAYMGLYFIHAGSDAEKALGYLKQYVATKPEDSVPYVLLGEAELEKRNYSAAADYLTEAKKVAHGRSSNLGWLLFQASYLKGDYVRAATLLDESFSHGKTVGDLKALISSDPRFAEIGKRPEFKRFFTMINGITAPRLSWR